MTDYLWHKISEKEKELIEQEAKDIITSFGDALEKVKDIPESVVERDSDVREEDADMSSPDHPPQQKKKDAPNFRDLMFQNAPNVKDDCIVGEKGMWIEPHFIHSPKRSQMKGSWIE